MPRDLHDVPNQSAAIECKPAGCDSEDEKRSWRRWLVLGFIFAVTVINFIDRQTLSVLAPVLRASYHLSNEAYGRIVAALQFGMMAGEFPMGWLMDRVGARIGLAAAVLWWSAATGCQAFTHSGFQLGATRLWMGTGEAGNFSGGMKAISRFFTQEERTLAIGIFNSGTMIGATLAPPLIVFLLERYGFRIAFTIPALLGLLWVPVWWHFYPGHRPVLSSDGVLKAPLAELLKQSSTWAVMTCRFLIGPVMQFYWYWIPSYLYSARHMSIVQIGVIAWLPFFLGDIGGILGGYVAGWLQRRNLKIYTVRRITMYGSSILCLSSLIVPYLRDAVASLFMIGFALMANTFLVANMFGAVTDLFPQESVGRATGLTGVSGGLSGLLFPLVTGVLVDNFSYRPAFIVVGLMPLLGTLALFILGSKYRSAS
ncbi:hexuronate transporter [Edaphobacter acidisoli]|uniref:Hexuronate transporter n=1 Tax=Edaphobacter acidisoli TaxID=2040573 RepID=A0A916W7G2_9BACT|nr:MFS transporter [Edaphobacter acidisoli]GGA73118.1 hexuronate transporter [Edaphobacter acidisoli]